MPVYNQRKRVQILLAQQLKKLVTFGCEFFALLDSSTFEFMLQILEVRMKDHESPPDSLPNSQI